MKNFNTLAAAVRTMAADPSKVGPFSGHFRASEFECGMGKGCVHCGAVVYIAPMVIVALEQIRDRFGTGLTILSGYRCKQHNAEIGGSRESMHILGCAADMQVPYGIDPMEFYYGVCAVAKSFHGGAGLYMKQRFVHIDLRYEKKDRRWTV